MASSFAFQADSTAEPVSVRGTPSHALCAGPSHARPGPGRETPARVTGRDMPDPFLRAAIDEAEQGLREGGIPIGSGLVRGGRIIGRGHNRRTQRGSVVLHGEMDAL